MGLRKTLGIRFVAPLGAAIAVTCCLPAILLVGCRDKTVATAPQAAAKTTQTGADLPPQAAAKTTPTGADSPQAAAKPPAATPANAAPVKLGLAVNDPRAFQGYTLIAPTTSTNTYLIDMQGKVVKTWKSDYIPACSAYLLENGHLLRTAALGADEGSSFVGAGPAGGRVQEFTWDGELVWNFKLCTDKCRPHHDIAKLPNGNVLMVVWDRRTAADAIAIGRAPATVGNHDVLPDAIVEVKPTGKTTGEIVWQWCVWDHLIQDHNASKAKYGNVAAHPELVDVNFSDDMSRVIPSPKDMDKLRSLGYIRSAAGQNAPPIPEWTHINAVVYNPDLDQIALSVRSFSEVWVIDHSTTTAKAAGHSGGRSGKGGDLLYRWGNPRAYRAGNAADQQLYVPHDAHWIGKGLPGAGHLLVFNNGTARPDGSYSSVEELVLPVDADGKYASKPGAAYGPEKPCWSYTAPTKTDFYSFIIAGAQRLPNGNTLICSGAEGMIFELNAGMEVVWKYVDPDMGNAGGPNGPGGPGGPSGPGGPGGPGRANGPGGPGGPGRGDGSPLGQVLPPFVQNLLGLTPEQRKRVSDLQKSVDSQVAQILNAQQAKQLKELRDRPPPGGAPGFGPGNAGAGNGSPGGPSGGTSSPPWSFLLGPSGGTKGPGPGGPPVGPFGPNGPPMGPPVGGMPDANGLFRAYRYGPDYPGLAGKTLTPGKTVEELYTENRGKKR